MHDYEVNSYRTRPSGTWQIFSKFLMIFNLFHKSFGEWNNTKTWEIRELFVILNEVALQ